MDEVQFLLSDLNTLGKFDPSRFHVSRRWYFGDVETNASYYMPRLQEYAHQGFEELILAKTGLNYIDFSREAPQSATARSVHEPPIQRMTFPCRWCHQLNFKPMYAGESYRISFDARLINARRIGIRAWVFDKNDTLASAVVWLRWAQVLDAKVGVIDIPDWFIRIFE